MELHADQVPVLEPGIKRQGAVLHGQQAIAGIFAVDKPRSEIETGFLRTISK
jgi:hypothetical protein